MTVGNFWSNGLDCNLQPWDRRDTLKLPSQVYNILHFFSLLPSLPTEASQPPSSLMSQHLLPKLLQSILLSHLFIGGKFGTLVSQYDCFSR